MAASSRPLKRVRRSLGEILRPRAGRKLRRFGFGLATLTGAAKKGFFIPHRHGHLAEPRAYAGLEPLFREAEPVMREILHVIEELGPALIDLRGPAPEPRFDQSWFARLDAAAAYAIVRRLAPTRIIEVGSGHSTRFMARAVADAGAGTAILCIDPAPRASLDGLGVGHLDVTLQEADQRYFRALDEGDILFIDSSHVAMPGTDVDILFGDLLPQLPSGVVIHVHDVVLPDAYPKDWDWRGYNEQLLVACLLQGGYRLLWSSHWVATRRRRWLEGSVIERLPLIEGTPETSVWLEKE